MRRRPRRRRRVARFRRNALLAHNELRLIDQFMNQLDNSVTQISNSGIEKVLRSVDLRDPQEVGELLDMIEEFNEISTGVCNIGDELAARLQRLYFSMDVYEDEYI